MDTDQTPTPRKRSRRGPAAPAMVAAEHSPRETPTALTCVCCSTTSSRGWSPCVVRLDQGPGAPRRGPRLSGSLTHGPSTSWFAAS